MPNPELSKRQNAIFLACFWVVCQIPGPKKSKMPMPRFRFQGRKQFKQVIVAISERAVHFEAGLFTLTRMSMLWSRR